jgi:fumarylacetoacetase
MIDATHDLALTSWVDGANGHPDFPIQNLPLGVFSPPAGGAPRLGVAIGDMILDLPAAGVGDVADVSGSTLNALFSRGPAVRGALRQRLSALLASDSDAADKLKMHRAADCVMHLPAAVGDYTDFYVGIHHATNVGKLFRPDNPLLPNYKYLPIGYHGRSSSLVVSGTPIRRPLGQCKALDAAEPVFGPSQRLDYELELAIWIGRGNPIGTPIPIDEAEQHIAGYGLLNDWSARDIQAWEYQPLGPFLSKNFGSTLSPWVITPEALAPFRIPQPSRPERDPAPLPYLTGAADQAAGAFDLDLEVWIHSVGQREKGLPPHRVALSNTRHMYWTVAQMVTHHASNGCPLNSGDLFGSGTISGPGPDGCGSLLETTQGGSQPLLLESGEKRQFLADGDEVLLRARASREGFVSIGFGECRAVVLPAPSEPARL